MARALEVSAQTSTAGEAIQRMKADDAKELGELLCENASLKRIVADEELENVALKEIAKGRMKDKCGVGAGLVVVAGGARRRPCARRRLELGHAPLDLAPLLAV